MLLVRLYLRGVVRPDNQLSTWVNRSTYARTIGCRREPNDQTYRLLAGRGPLGDRATAIRINIWKMRNQEKAGHLHRVDRRVPAPSTVVCPPDAYAAALPTLAVR